MSEWIFAVLLTLAPVERYAAAQALPGWEETAERRTERYRAIAADVDAVLADTPPLFRGPVGKKQTAALLLAVADHESGFAPDVDLGPCYRGKNGASLRCDSGRAACVMQLHGTREELKEFFADRKQCLRRGLERLRRSLGACRHLPAERQLAAYASGNCNAGYEESKAILAEAQRAFAVREPVK